jgi:hypothetical protein
MKQHVMLMGFPDLANAEGPGQDPADLFSIRY